MTNLAPVRLEVVDSHGIQKGDDGWEHYSYSVRLSRGDESLNTPWRQGLGITELPNAGDVLASLIMDAAGFTNARDFEDWASEYGYDTDSRKALASWEQIDALSDGLRDLLGDDDFESAISGDAEEEAARLTTES
jgi:hypothetical protein